MKINEKIFKKQKKRGEKQKKKGRLRGMGASLSLYGPGLGMKLFFLRIFNRFF
ncbi:MAG: hypothetical protein HF314_11600 [Ignavibacteria bacterium]|jgi:hypothetical protein|nr:hypothetical protein [Ignavibacteria bacterium]MCU7503714.1 hypothetical protein [Ignavibacteria bacterium]MCU7517640.1 hypothetical protein [Ignavibacteria bacterium]